MPEGCLGVVMPVFNEASTLGLVVAKILARVEVGELIMVDDGSSDGTWNLMRELEGSDPRIRIFRNRVNQGKGAALRLGMQHARSGILVIQDADLEYDPEDYPKLLRPILSGEADVVYGSRLLGTEMRREFGFLQKWGNRFLTGFFNRRTGLKLTDMETCYKMFRRELLERIQIEEDRFGFEPEFTAKLAKLGVGIREVPIRYRGRSYRQGKKIGWRDGLSAIRCILKYSA